MKNLSIVSDEELNNFYNTVAKNIKRLRRKKNKPQLDLVLEMGLRSTSFYSKCENAKDNHHFNLEHLYKISRSLDIDIEEFFKK